MINSITESVLLLEPDGTVLVANETVARRLETTVGELVGRNIADFVPVELAESRRAKGAEVVVTKRPARFEDVRAGRDTQVTIYPVLDAEGAVASLAVFGHDVTEQRATEEALKRTQQQLAQSERLRALGSMAGGIAHEFNNSLGPIVGFTDMLLKRPAVAEDAEKRTRLLRNIYTAATDAAATVERLRDFYRSREGDEAIEPLSIRELVSTTVSMTRPKWRGEAEAGGRRIRLTTHLQDAPPVVGNPTELRQVLTNLVFNAVDAMPAGGVISVRTASEDGKVLIEVTDTGIGMSEEVRKRCLDPFFTTKHERGSGLGLAMVYGTVQRHGGTIEVESEEGRGTTFRIWLPAFTGVAASGTEEQPAVIRHGPDGERLDPVPGDAGSAEARTKEGGES
jgi:signal transduction histidine kinase